MATITDFALISTGVGSQATIPPPQWFRLHNNETAIDYYTISKSDAASGAFSYSNVPPDDYTLYSGPTPTVVGTPTLISSHYRVPYTAGDDMVMHSGTAKSASPYTPNSEASTGGSLINKQFYLGPPGGLGDDQALFDNAMTLIAAQGGGTLNCQPGTYRAEPRPKSYIKLKGANHFATCIKRRDASATADVIALFDARQEQVELEDLFVDGNTGGSGAAGTGNGIYFHNDSATNGAFASALNNPRHRVRNVFVRNCYGDGAKFDGDSFAGACEIDGLSTYFCNGNGLTMNSPDSAISNVDAGQSGLSGIVDAGGNNRYTGCKAWLSGRVTVASGWGFKVTSSTFGCTLAACVAQDNAKDGFTFFGSRNVVATGLVADSNGRGTAGYGVFMDTAQGCEVSVTAFDRQGVPTQLYGVWMGTGVKNIVRLTSGIEATAAILAADLLTDNIITVEQPGSTANSRVGGNASFDALTALTSIVAPAITATASLAVGADADAAGGQVTINGAAASNRDVLIKTAGVLRWVLRTNNTAESGGNAGSDLVLLARDDAGAALKTALQITRSSGVIQFGNKIWPATDAGAQQTAAGIYAGTGVPNNANGANGDFYFRSDGGAGTCIYQRRAGAWVATAA